MNELSFETLRQKNKARSDTYIRENQLGEWSESDWACALAGEVGEMCNFIKKRLRRPDDKTLHLEDIKKEIGDIQTYLDLVATKFGFRLEDCVVDKFNEVSKRFNSEVTL